MKIRNPNAISTTSMSTPLSRLQSQAAFVAPSMRDSGAARNMADRAGMIGVDGGHSALMFASRTTLPHLAISLSM